MASQHGLCRLPMKALHEHPYRLQLVLAADPPYPPSISCLKLMTTDRSVMARVTDLLTIKNKLQSFRRARWARKPSVQSEAAPAVIRYQL